MPIEKIDIFLTKDLIKEIDIAVQRVEKKAKSCEPRGIIIDFEATDGFIKKAGHMIAEMRYKEPENIEILEMAKKFASIDKRNFDARFEFENNCICTKKEKREKHYIKYK